MLDSNWLSLKWRPPKENGGDPEITYKVRYAPYLESGEFGSPVEIETTELQIDLMDLKERTMYRVEVVAVNRGGESEPSSRRYQVPGIGGGYSSTSLSNSVNSKCPLSGRASFWGDAYTVRKWTNGVKRGKSLATRMGILWPRVYNYQLRQWNA